MKTPKIAKPDAEERTEAVLAKAIERSRKSGKRNELRATRHNDREIAAERARGTMTSKARAALRDRFTKKTDATSTRRRFFFFRRKARPEAENPTVDPETPPAV